MQERTYDGRKILAELSGLSEHEIDRIHGEVKANLKRLRSCAKHRFNIPEQVGIGKSFKCQHCNGVLKLTAIAEYIRGYEAAGKPGTDIWSGWKK